MGDAKNKIAIYSPYLDILGGGERYVLTIASILSENYLVDIIWDKNDILEIAQKKLKLDLSRVNLVKKPGGIGSLSRLSSTYRLFFYLTDGSLFYPLSKKSILIIQSPVHIPPQTLINKLKMARYQKIICYSDYVKGFILKIWSRQVMIIPPGINTANFFCGQKENLILSVGRFFPWLHNKRQDILVDAFRMFIQDISVKGWRLVLIGSVDKGAQDYLNKIKSAVKGLPVEILINVSFEKLVQNYSKAKIYWHAAGYGANLNKHPEFAEHFGISTVEAMASGCVPLVFKAGGQKEIISEGVNGYLWDDISQLVEKTLGLIANPVKLSNISAKARLTSKNYDVEVFAQNFKNCLINES